MKKRRFIQNLSIIVLGIAIIVMSIGYAAYSTPMSITGNTTIQRASWDIKFNNPTNITTSTSVADSMVSGPTLSNSTTLNFGVTLKVGETYDFTVDVVNAGTFNAILDTFSLTGTKTKGSSTSVLAAGTTAYSNDYLKYNVTWANGDQLSNTDTLAVAESKKLKVHVEFQQPLDASTLPDENETYVFTLNLNFAQNN